MGIRVSSLTETEQVYTCNLTLKSFHESVYTRQMRQPAGTTKLTWINDASSNQLVGPVKKACRHLLPVTNPRRSN